MKSKTKVFGLRYLERSSIVTSVIGRDRPNPDLSHGHISIPQPGGSYNVAYCDLAGQFWLVNS